jgi:ribosomal protein S18 acetylase RimI-like enzyme
MSKIQFRLATNADIALLLDFMQQFYAIDQYAFDEDIARATLQTFITDHTLGRLWLIDEDTQPVGYIAITFGYSFEYHGRDAFIDELFLLASHRSRGIGTLALQFANKACQELGVKALHLEVEQTNHAAQALYCKMGFVSHAQRYLMTRWITD